MDFTVAIISCVSLAVAAIALLVVAVAYAADVASALACRRKESKSHEAVMRMIKEGQDLITYD